MKLKHFFLTILIFLIFQLPMTAHTNSEIGLQNLSATGALAEEIFTFDPKLAPIKLEYVDFKINRNRTVEEWGKDIGQYNFKLFGCKRREKNVVLNEGRTMRRDMKFEDVFFEELNELFPVLVRKDSPYFPYSLGQAQPNLLPGYVVTAEIKDLFINVCDQYDWRTRTYSQLRSGSSEIKVQWRVMTPFNRKLYWEGVTKGYAEVQTPIRDGEVRLIEKAFGDALVRLVGMPGFLTTLRTIPNIDELEKAKAEFDALAYEHKKYKKLNSSYRRKRTIFYTERQKERVLEDLEHIVHQDREFSGGLDKLTARDLEDLERRLAAGHTLTPEEMERLEKGRALSQESYASDTLERGLGQSGSQSGLSGRGLDGSGSQSGLLGRGLDGSDSQSGLLGRGLDGSDSQSGVFARGLNDNTKNAFYARLLTEQALENAVLARLLPHIPLVKHFDSSILPSDLERENQKYGFIVSKVDGWITINKQKPFRYLSPIRLYRIRSSVVSVTQNDLVGSGLVIAPGLVLTNYDITENVTQVKTEFLDGRSAPAIVLRADKDTDVALLYLPPTEFNKYNWPVPLRLDLPEVGEKFYAIGTPMQDGFEGALEKGKVSGYRFSETGVDILTTTNVQSVTMGGALVDENGNAIGLAHSGKSLVDNRDGFIPIGDAFDVLKVRIRDYDIDETPSEKARRLREMQENYIK